MRFSEWTVVILSGQQLLVQSAGGKTIPSTTRYLVLADGMHNMLTQMAIGLTSDEGATDSFVSPSVCRHLFLFFDDLTRFVSLTVKASYGICGLGRAVLQLGG